jgi:uncharacterized protein with NAD-binding domain and iron-sulfur cluster
MSGKQRIAILGGGVGAMTAAFELTSAPDWQSRYDVTVYQMGWRLGGKGASGRNARYGDRIEEHGLHIFFGFYENAFRMLRRCYKELGRPPGAPLASVNDAFKPHGFVTFEEVVDGRWTRWNIYYPEDPDSRPWQGGVLPSLQEMVDVLLGWLAQAAAARPAVREALKVSALAAGIEDLIATVFHERHRLDHCLATFVNTLETFARDRSAAGDDLRRLFILADLSCAAIRGLDAEGVLSGKTTFDDLDRYELKEFLTRYGARPESVTSAIVRGYYDLAFAFQDGRTDRENSGAGTAVRALLRMCVTYHGAFMWKMQAGMGDTIFGPLYEVLKSRGVRFEFFHRIDTLELAADKARIARIHATRQVQLTPGTNGTYDPLVDVAGLPCWPSEPRCEQIVGGDAIRAYYDALARGESPKNNYDLESRWCDWPSAGAVVLEDGRDFDLVVLGISLGALKDLCGDLCEASPRWRDMVDRVGTCQTQSVQLWLAPTIQELGWEDWKAPGEPTVQRTVVDAYVDPINSWADMSQLLVRERWPAGSEPKTVAYFCGPLADMPVPPPTDVMFPAREERAVQAMARGWLDENTQGFWPRATRGASRGLDWNLLVDPAGRAGEARLDAQFFRANIDPSERYVQSLKGTTQFRLHSGDSGFANLYLAGDWTWTPLNVGCAEAAVMSGMQASRAICGCPTEIVGDPEAGTGPVARRNVPFITRGAEEAVPPPYRFRNLRIRSFPLKADPVKMQAACDRYLNIAPPDILEYRVLGEYVYLQIATYGSLVSEVPAWVREGWFSENEAAILLLVAAGRRRHGTWQPHGLAYFMPYLWVDNPYCITTGREVFGYPKEFCAP